MEKDKQNKQVLIIGAGPAGLAAAWELSSKGYACFLLEKENQVGGICRTLEFEHSGEKYRTDLGPHRFFTKNQELLDKIKNLLGPDFISVKRQTRQYIKGKFYDYPINAVQAFKNIGFFNSAAMFFSYLWALFLFKVWKSRIDSFEDYIVANFGRRLGEFNMLNYTKKVWGVDCSKIHPDWAKQRIKGLNLFKALGQAFFSKKREAPKTLIDSFYYPKYGAGYLYEKIAEEIVKNGGKILLETKIIKIRHDAGRVREVEFSHGNGLEIFLPDFIINTAPLDELIFLLDPEAGLGARNASHRLKWRYQAQLFLGVNKASLFKDNWLYFPDEELPFGRVSEMKNFSSVMAPAQKSSLLVEFFLDDNEKAWQEEKDYFIKQALPVLEKAGILKAEEIIFSELLKIRKAYPFYDLEYRQKREEIFRYLDGFSNLFSIGRGGSFEYNNQDHSLESGLEAAHALMAGHRLRREYLGNEYLESGKWQN